MQLKEKSGLKWLEFDLLSDLPDLKHAVFLRQGGTSLGKFDSLNLSLSVGDSQENVEANLKKAADLLELPQIISSKQCHGKVINEIFPTTSFKNIQGDALTTSHPEIGLMINHADCQAAIIYDPIRRAIANVHAGWRGSAQNIYAETIEFMKATYRTDPKDLIIAISPSLGPQNAEFINYRQELPEFFWQFQIKPNYFDFWAISTWQLRQCGVLAHHIEIAQMCTYADHANCFSYRRENITGRHGTIVALKSI